MIRILSRGVRWWLINKEGLVLDPLFSFIFRKRGRETKYHFPLLLYPFKLFPSGEKSISSSWSHTLRRWLAVVFFYIKSKMTMMIFQSAIVCLVSIARSGWFFLSLSLDDDAFCCCCYERPSSSSFLFFFLFFFLVSFIEKYTHSHTYTRK